MHGPGFGILTCDLAAASRCSERATSSWVPCRQPGRRDADKGSPISVSQTGPVISLWDCRAHVRKAWGAEWSLGGSSEGRAQMTDKDRRKGYGEGRGGRSTTHLNKAWLLVTGEQ